jgi:hypothetical protein
MENDPITSEVVDVNEFTRIGIKCNVLGVPKTVINENLKFVGVVLENVLLDHIFETLKIP